MGLNSDHIPLQLLLWREETESTRLPPPGSPGEPGGGRRALSQLRHPCSPVLLDYYPIEFEVEELHSTNIANSVFNSFLSYTAIMLNIATIHAIRKTP